MKKMAFLMILTVFFASVNVYGAAEENQTIIGLSAEPIVGRTIEVITNDEPTTVQWKCSDSKNGTYSDIAGETKKSLLVNPDLMGKWIKAEVDGTEGEPYQETSVGTILCGEDFSNYTDEVETEENGNKYYDNTGRGNRLTFSFDKQTEGRVVVEFRYKYAGEATDSMVLSLNNEAGNEGAVGFFYTDSIGTWGQVNSGFSYWLKPKDSNNNDGKWHTIQIIANLTTKGMEMYIDGQKRVSPGQTKWDTKYFQDDLSKVTCDFRRSFSMDDLKIYKINDNNEAPYVEGMLRLMGDHAEIKSEYSDGVSDFNGCIIKDYDHDNIAWVTYDWFYSAAENGTYAKTEDTGVISNLKSDSKYVKCVVSVCDELGAVTSVTMGPSLYILGKQMPYMHNPTLSGDCVVGGTLTRSAGYQAGEYGQTDKGTKWYRADAAASSWTEIGAGDTYTITSADAGQYITCCVLHDASGDEVNVNLTRMAPPVFVPEIKSLQYVTEGESSTAKSAKVVAEIKNKTGNGFSFKIINAYYQDERLADVEILSYLLPEGTGYVKIAAPLTKMNDGYAVKSFLIKDFGSLMPLAAAAEYETSFADVTE